MQNRMTFSRLILLLLAVQTILFFYVFYQQKSRLAQPQPPQPIQVFSCNDVAETVYRQVVSQNQKSVSPFKCKDKNCPESAVEWRRTVHPSSPVIKERKNSEKRWMVIAIDGAGVKAERHGAIPEIKVHLRASASPISLFLSNKKSVVWNIINPKNAPLGNVIVMSDTPTWVTGLKENSTFEWMSTRYGCRQAWAAEDELNPEMEFDLMMEAFARHTGAQKAQFLAAKFGDEFHGPLNFEELSFEEKSEIGIAEMKANSLALETSREKTGSAQYFLFQGRLSLKHEQNVQSTQVFALGSNYYEFQYSAPTFRITRQSVRDTAAEKPSENASVSAHFQNSQLKKDQISHIQYRDLERAAAELRDVHWISNVRQMVLAADQNGLHAFDIRTKNFHQVLSWNSYKLRDTRPSSSNEASFTLLVSRLNDLAEVKLPLEQLEDAITQKKVLNKIDVEWKHLSTHPQLKAYPDHWSYRYTSEGEKRGLRIFKPQNLKGEFVLLSGASDLSVSSAQK